MTERNRWEPKPLLEEREWSLLPNVRLSVRAGRVALAVWFGVLGIVYFVNAPAWMRFIPAAIGGGWCVHYVTCRLGGRPAPTGGASPAVRINSPFQARLAFDVLAIGVGVTALVLLIAQ